MVNTLNKSSIVKWKVGTDNSIVASWSRPLTNTDNINHNGNDFRARPIKHWRKQLFPRDSSSIIKTTSIPFDKPGGNTISSLNLCNGDLDNVNFLEENTKTNTQTYCINTKLGITGEIIESHNPKIIRRSTTNLDKSYYTDSRAYLKSRCKTFQQNLSGNNNNNPNNFDSNGQQLWPNNDNNGPQVRYNGSICHKCDDTSNDYKCSKIIYKPNNRNYSTQGAVTSGERLLRLKLNTINKNGASFLTAYGEQGANAGKYHGTSEGPYFLKSKQNNCTNYHRKNHKTVCFNNN